MAFSTLLELRTRLNGQLGITDGADEPWGTVEERNSAIRWGFEQLPPTMMRLVEEDVTLNESQREYELADIHRVILVEQTLSDGYATRDLKNWRSIRTADSDPPVTRLTFATALDTTTTVRVTGYAPYVSQFANDSAACDIPQDIEWIPLLGAMAELYRRRFHEWLDFERFNASNPSTVLDPEVIYRAYNDALQRFEQAKLDHFRQVSLPRAASLKR